MRPLLPREWQGTVGWARAPLSPPAGIRTRNWGAAEWDVCEGADPDLSCSCLVLGDPPLVLVALDLGWWRAPQHEASVRQRVLELLELPEDRLILHLTHTHAGPSLDPDEEDLPGGREVKDFVERLPSLIASTARTALMDRREGLVQWERSPCRLARFREFRVNGRWVVGSGTEEPTDNDVWAGRVTQEKAPPLILLHYACHPTTLHWENRVLSADYPGAARAMVEGAAGGPCLFLQGCSADLGPLHGFTGRREIAEANGRMVGGSALSALSSLPPPGMAWQEVQVASSGAPILLGDWGPAILTVGSSSEVITVSHPLLPPPAEEPETSVGAKERNLRRAKVRQGLKKEVRLWLWKVGDMRFIGLPLEAPSTLQSRLRRAFPHLVILPMNVSNGWLGYLCQREDPSQDRYTVGTSLFEPGLLEKVEEALMRSLP